MDGAILSLFVHLFPNKKSLILYKFSYKLGKILFNITIEFSEKSPVSLDSSGSRERKRPFQGLGTPLSPSSETSVGNYSEGSISI